MIQPLPLGLPRPGGIRRWPVRNWCDTVWVMPFKDPDKRKAKNRAWRLANPEKQAAATKRWVLANPEYERARKAAWALANPEKARARQKAWSLAHPVRRRAHGATRRARELDAFIEVVDHDAVFVRDGGVCQICDRFIGTAQWHVDHRIPLARGGEHSYANTQLAHAVCNWVKGARV